MASKRTAFFALECWTFLDLGGSWALLRMVSRHSVRRLRRAASSATTMATRVLIHFDYCQQQWIFILPLSEYRGNTGLFVIPLYVLQKRNSKMTARLEVRGFSGQTHFIFLYYVLQLCLASLLYIYTVSLSKMKTLFIQINLSYLHYMT